MAGEIPTRSSVASLEPSIKVEHDGLDEGHAVITGHSHRYPDFPNLRQAAEVESVEVIDRLRATGNDVLNQVAEKLLQVGNSRDVIGHRKTIHNLKKSARNPKPILGVVGSTGHGKSSLINALLGESQLIPTNCVQACTAVITEISWNTSNNPERLYRADVVFISADEWLNELKRLLGDIKAASNEAAGEPVDEDTDIEVSLAKVNAVYPNITQDDLVKMDPETLLNEKAVHERLGTTWEVVDSKPGPFYRNVAKYISSLQKGDSEKLEEGSTTDGEKHKMQLWPLIKVVRIYTKAEALSTGAVIVDLVSFTSKPLTSLITNLTC